MKLKVSIGAILLQVKNGERLPVTYQKLEEGHKIDSVSQFSEGTNPAYALISDF